MGEGIRLIENREGVWWYKAPIPRRWHRCKPWTTGISNHRVIYRCACGAIRVDPDGNWWERNSRRNNE